MIKIPEKNIIKKGRLGPGELIAVDLKEGKLYQDREIKDYISKEYKQFNSQIVDLDKKLKVNIEEVNFSGNDLRRRQYLSGYSVEDLELILHPMVEEAKEATGSMGDDTPVAVLSSHFRPISHYFRQNFAKLQILY